MVLYESTDLLVVKYLDAYYTLFEHTGLNWRYLANGVEKVSSTDSDVNIIAKFLLKHFLNDFRKDEQEFNSKADSALNDSISFDNVYLKKDLSLNIGYFSSCPTNYLKELEHFKGKVYATPILTPVSGFQVVRFS